MEYKNEKGLYFQDFKELLLFLNTLSGKNTLLLFETEFPYYFSRKKDRIVYRIYYLDKATGLKLTNTLQTTKLNSCFK